MVACVQCHASVTPANHSADGPGFVPSDLDPPQRPSLRARVFIFADPICGAQEAGRCRPPNVTLTTESAGHADCKLACCRRDSPPHPPIPTVLSWAPSAAGVRAWGSSSYKRCWRRPRRRTVRYHGSYRQSTAALPARSRRSAFRCFRA